MTESETRRNPLGQPVGLPVPGWTPRRMPRRSAMAGRFARVEPLDVERHAAELFEANAEDREGRNWTYYNYGPFATLADYRKWVESSCADKTRLFHAIIDQASGKAVGVGAYANMQPAHGTIEIGALNFSPRLQRQPAATEAMYLMMRRVFSGRARRPSASKTRRLSPSARRARAATGWCRPAANWTARSRHA